MIILVNICHVFDYKLNKVSMCEVIFVVVLYANALQKYLSSYLISYALSLLETTDIETALK